MIQITKHVDATLDWHTTTTSPTIMTILCAGRGYLEYQSNVTLSTTFFTDDDDDDDEDEDEEYDDEEYDQGRRKGRRDNLNTDDEDDDDDNKKFNEDDTSPELDLFALSEKELEALNYYQVLHLPFRKGITQDDVKKAYRKASLKYHPDKSGRDEGEDDPVFLKVKAAFETLSTQRQAYDSTEMPFDDSLPDENPEDFYKEYGPVFERNLHFDARLVQGLNSGTGSKKTWRGVSDRSESKQGAQRTRN